MFAVALLLRLVLAPRIGFFGDLALFQEWAERLAEVGPGRFYVAGSFQDYPPGYLYVLWLLGKLSTTPSWLLLKLPPIAADLGLAWVSGVFAARLAPAQLRERWPVRTLVVAGVLFNPAVIALGAGWGQVDSVTALLVSSALLLFFTAPARIRYEIPAFLLFAVAVAMKPQSGFVLPVVLYALYRRRVHGRPRPDAIDGVLAICVSGALALVTWSISGLAFGLGPLELFRFYARSASVYPVTSANALNLWGAMGFWRSDTATVAGLSLAQVGMLLFLLGTALVLVRTHRALEGGASQPLAFTIAAAAVGLLAYTVLTRMHERYLFVPLLLLAPLAIVRPLRYVYAGLSALFLLDLWYPFTYFNVGWKAMGQSLVTLHEQPWFDLLLGGLHTDTWQKRLWSLAIVGIAFFVVWYGPRLAFAGAPLGQTVPTPDEPRERPETPRPPWLRSRWGPYSLVALACAFGLVVLRPELTPAPNLNDSAFQLQMVRWASGQIEHGRVPLDGWYPYLSLGSSFFHHYQSLPNVLTAYLARLTGAGDQTTYLWILYLLLALWPLSVYAGARLLAWGRWPAAGAAAVSPLLVSASGYGYEHGSYTWQGYGVYTQLWAMWLLPLAWGLSWRSVTRGRTYAAAALVLALTIACHFITGYLALLTLAVWVLAGGAGYLRRAARAALLGGSSLIVAAWVLVPLLRDTKWTTQSVYYKGTIFADSYGARKVLGWLFRGELFDAGRFPVLSLLVALGAVVCSLEARRDTRARALLGAFLLSLLLFFGRPTLGPVIDLLPGMRDVQIHRFLMGVHLAGILLAGVGIAWLVRRGGALAAKWPPGRRTPLVLPAAVVLVVLALAPGWIDRGRYDLGDANLIRQQRTIDRTDGRDLDRLVAIAKERGGGRVYAGLRGNWGKDYTVGYVPVYAWLADRQVDAIGFTFRTIASLSTDVEASFDETNPAQYSMFGVRWLLLPAGRHPPVPAHLVASSGRHRLWQVRTGGYLQVVDRAAALTADRTDLDAATAAFRSSRLALRALYPGVAFAGAKPPLPTFVGAAPPPGAPGRVLRQSAQLTRGSFSGTIVARRPAVVLLKASYDPHWTATVDGFPARPEMMAPSLVGVQVPAGRHVVRFVYAPYRHYLLLGGLGLLTLAALALVPRRQAFRAP